MIPTQKPNIFWIFSLSIVFGLTLPVLIQDAMFQDAVLYSSVAHNMSVGFGNFWFPQYSTLNLEGIPSFHEQPPLVFGILAVFYKIFGSSIYVERVYTFLMLILHIVLIHKLWKEVFSSKPDYKNKGWLAVLFWILIPICFWSFRNNMIENTMGVFILLSVLLSYKAIQKENAMRLWFLSGFCIFLATFSKGVPGLFPIVLPVLYALIFRNISLRKSLLYASILVLVPVLMYGILFCFPEPRHSLSIYFFDRFLGRVEDMPTTVNRLETARRLLSELFYVLILIAAILLIAIKSISHKWKETNKEFLFFLLLGLSGSLPLMLTMVQKGLYMVPSFPYFAIAFASLVLPYVSLWINKVSHKVYIRLGYFFILLFTGVITFTVLQVGKISREEETLTDVYKIGAVVPKFSTLTVPKDQYDEYNFILQGFLVRHFHISISPYEEYEYFLVEKDTKIRIPVGYQPVELGLRKYNLYRR